VEARKTGGRRTCSENRSDGVQSAATPCPPARLLDEGFEFLALVEDDSLWPTIADEHERTVAAVLEIVEARELLDRQPVIQRSVRLRNPYVDPMNAIQVELLRRHRAGDESARLPLSRSIAGIASALRNTG